MPPCYDGSMTSPTPPGSPRPTGDAPRAGSDSDRGSAAGADARDSHGARDSREDGDPPRLDPERVARFGRGQALVFDRVLGSLRAAAVAQELKGREASLTPAGIGTAPARTDASAIRGDRTTWVERLESPPLAPLWSLFDHLARELREAAWLGTDGLEVQLALYPGAGECYQRHRDAFRSEGRRRATAIYFLNPSWTAPDGGELRLFDQPGERDVEPHLDRLVLFAARSLPHAVRPCHAPRWAVTAWFLGPERPGGSDG